MRITSRIASAAVLSLGTAVIAIGTMATAPDANASGAGDLYDLCLKGSTDAKSCCLVTGGVWIKGIAAEGCTFNLTDRPVKVGTPQRDNSAPPVGPTKPPAPVNTVPPPLIQK